MGLLLKNDQNLRVGSSYGTNKPPSEKPSFPYEHVADVAITGDDSESLHVYCNTLQHTATHCNTLQHTATHRTTEVYATCGVDTSEVDLQHTATHCDTLQHTATHCNTLQHTAAHCNTPHRCSRCDLHNISTCRAIVEFRRDPE